MCLGRESKRGNKEGAMYNPKKTSVSALFPQREWSNCILSCKNSGIGMLSALLPDACFLFSRVWDVVFIRELLRMSDFYDL